MAEIETTSTFTGETAAAVLAALCCLPLGAYYYFANKEQMWVCPNCRETVEVGASTCHHCDEDLSQYK